MISNESWDIRIDSALWKEMRPIPKEIGRRIVAVIENPYFEPYGGDIRKIGGEKNIWARRIGEYRIFYEIDQEARRVNVFHVERRNTQTYRRGKHRK